MLTYHQRGYVAFFWEQFRRNCSRYQFRIWVWKRQVEIIFKSPRGQWVNDKLHVYKQCTIPSDINILKPKNNSPPLADAIWKWNDLILLQISISLRVYIYIYIYIYMYTICSVLCICQGLIRVGFTYIVGVFSNATETTNTLPSYQGPFFHRKITIINIRACVRNRIHVINRI